MRDNEEKSLKRWLKRKVKVTLGMMVAFMITGTVGFAIDKIENEEPFILNEGKVEINQDELNMNLKGKGSNAFLIHPKDTNTDASANINIVNNFTITNEAESARGITVENGGSLSLNAKNINITAINSSDKINKIAMGIELDNYPNSIGKGGKIDIEADSVNILAKATHENGWAYGINCITRTTDLEEDKVSKIEIKAKDTTIIAESVGKGQSNGILAWSQGQVRINNGNVSIKADNIINARGNSLVEINKDNNSNNTVKLDGDIIFEYDGINSKTPVDSNITINLSNSDSYFKGNIYKIASYKNENGEIISKKFEDLTDEELKKIGEDNLKVTEMDLGLSNGAQWNTDASSFVNTLNFNNGIININGGGEQTVSLYNVKGEGGTVNIKTSIGENGFDAGKLVVGKESEENIVLLDNALGPKLDVNFTGITSDNINVKEFEDLVKESINMKGEQAGKIDTTVKVEEGLIEGAITGELGSDGKLDTSTIKQSSSTSTLDGIEALTTNTYIAWKQEMNSLNKRMGELRNSTGNEGVWARVYGGESEYNEGYKNKYQTYQVGYDKKYSTTNGTGFIGYLVSYTQGDTDYNHNSHGSGDNTSVGGGIYGTWLGNSGDYVDVIFKVSRLENDFDITSLSGINSKGDYNTFGMSLGLEYGRRFDLTRGFFLEPSIGMNLGRVGAEDYRTSSGLNIEQDTIYTAEGKIGAALGYNFAKGNVYVRVAGVKEFEGELDTTINGKALPTEDLGDSWIEYGVGANYRVLENLNLYVDIERTGSAEVETNWQGNLGFRYEF